MTLDVVTIERQVLHAEDVDVVVAPGTEGLLGILPNHAPIVTGLAEGVLEIVRGSEREIFAIGGGFMEVRHSHVIVMADAAEHAEEVDLERAQEARQRAEQALAGSTEKVEREEALAALRRAQTRIKVGQKRRSSGSARVG